MAAERKDAAPGQAHWDRYWQADRVSACLTDPCSHNYGTAIRPGWAAFFGALPAGARLLDIGTGNGAIAIIASETGGATGKRFEIHGVDSADIDPIRYLADASPALRAIRFHGCTQVESLPFPDAYFDAVTSQYALEYTELPKTVAELRRVTTPGAALRFVLHASEATPPRNAQRDLADIAFLKDELQLLDKARELMRSAFAFERAPAFDAQLKAQAATALDIYLAAAQQADTRYSDARCAEMFRDLLMGVRSAWDRRRELTLGFILEGIDAIDTEMSAHRARLQEMCRAALTEEALGELAKLFESNGFDAVVTGEVRAPDSGDLLGWCLTARRDNR